jgi:hypothetical protein
VAVSALANSVVVRNSAIDARFPGGMSAFARSCPNQSFCTDGTISRVGFMVEADARTFVTAVATAGLAPPGSDVSPEIAVVRQGQGFAYPCDWLQLGLFDGLPAVWLVGTDRGSLYLPQGERNAFESTIPIAIEELSATFDFVGLKGDGKIEVYQHKITGEVRYVGRPYNPVRKWWHFWKTAHTPRLDQDDLRKIYTTACELITPYVEHQLEQPPLGRSARKQLQQGCEMLSRVLQSNPRSWGALWFRGMAHRGLRQLEPAYDDFRAAYSLEKTNRDVGREFAGICIALGRGAEAVPVSRELLDKYPNDAGLTSNYALSLLISGNLAEAEAVVESSLRLDPGDGITQSLSKFIASIKAHQIPRPDRWPSPSSQR